MKFVTISDTHGKHKSLSLPAGNVLIHTGDISMRGDQYEVTDFFNWFTVQPYQYKILIAGNHDFFFERESPQAIASIIPKDVIYLNDSGTCINDINIWGSPVSPWFFNWAFNRHRGEPIKKHWDLIPPNTNILITHGPVLGILDETTNGKKVGCEDLLNKVQEIKPAVHICGHIHEAYGEIELNGTKFINASVLNHRYVLTNKPIVFEL